MKFFRDILYLSVSLAVIMTLITGCVTSQKSAVNPPEDQESYDSSPAVENEKIVPDVEKDLNYEPSAELDEDPYSATPIDEDTEDPID